MLTSDPFLPTPSAGTMSTGCSAEVLAALTAGGAFTEAQANALCSSGLVPDVSSLVDGDTLGSLKYGVNSGWLVLCGALVFIMHGGFAMVSARRANFQVPPCQTLLQRLPAPTYPAAPRARTLHPRCAARFLRARLLTRFVS